MEVSVRVECAKLEGWSEGYVGEKFHAVLCDPPYGLEFMGKEWDAPHKATSMPKAGALGGFADGNKPSFARQGRHLRKLVDVYASWGSALLPHVHPGALVLMFGGTRTWHYLALGMEDAGFEMWDTLMWLYGSGFPKAQSLYCKCDGKTAAPHTEHDVRRMSEANIQASVDVTAEQREALQPRVSECGISTARPDATGGGSQGAEELRMEGRSDILPQTRQLQADQVCPLPGGISSDGAQGRLRDGASSDHGDVGGTVPNPDGGGAPRESQPTGQREDESRTLAGQSLAQDGGARCATCGKLRDARWVGHKTCALKPAWEPILCFKAPNLGKTYAQLATEYGSGCLNIDGGRIECDTRPHRVGDYKETANNVYVGRVSGDLRFMGGSKAVGETSLGRYPANLCLDEEAAQLLDLQTGNRKAGASVKGDEPSEPTDNCYGEYTRVPFNGFGDSGGASRFFYCAKASSFERHAGLGAEPLNTQHGATPRQIENALKAANGNTHPTVKPIDLCRWLATLLLPPDSVQPRRFLVPFAGSGSEMIGAMLAGWDEVVGVEQDAAYVEIAKTRIAHWKAKVDAEPKQDSLFP